MSAVLGPRDIRSEILRAGGRPDLVPAGEPEPRQENQRGKKERGNSE